LAQAPCVSSFVPLAPAAPLVAMALKVLAVSLLLGVAGANELTSANWDAAVAGKTVFIKFQAPW